MDLVAELSSNTKVVNDVLKVVPLMAKAAEYRHYTQHLHLLETVCKQVSGFTQGVGRRKSEGVTVSRTIA